MTLKELNQILQTINNLSTGIHDYEQITVALAIISREIKLKEMTF